VIRGSSSAHGVGSMSGQGMGLGGEASALLRYALALYPLLLGYLFYLYYLEVNCMPIS
jgi:hypothetical protein